MNQIINNIKKIIYYTVPWLILVWYGQIIFNNSIWLDEAFSLSMIDQSFIDIIKNTVIDVHPPLYYIILKSIVDILKLFEISNTIWVAKLVSMIPIGILMIVSYIEIAKLFGKKAVFLFNILILGMPQILQYSVEIRMYSLGLLFVTLFYISYIKWDKDNRNKELYKMIIFAVLSFYTHYFAGVSVACIYFFIIIESIIKKDYTKLKKVSLSIAIILLLYLPWIIVFIKQLLTVKENYWIEPITLNTVKEFIRFPYTVNNSKILSYIILGLILISLVPVKNSNNKNAIYGFLVPVGTTVVGIVVSEIIRPIFISRYMLCSLGCLWLAVAVKLGSTFKKKYIFYIIVILALVITICSNYKIIENEEKYKKAESNLDNYMSNIITDDISIVFDSNQLQRIIAYYYPNIETYVYKQEITELTKQVYKQTNMYILEDAKSLNSISKNLYIFTMKEDILQQIKENNYYYEKCGDYQIEMYRFSIYKVLQ